MARNKQTDKLKYSRQRIKVAARAEQSYDNAKVIWTFESIDRDGKFKFDPSRADFDCQDVLGKLLSFSTMTWNEIKQQTHDANKSKHHFLSPKSLSKEALERVSAKDLLERADYIFSFALTNTVRVIGYRDENDPAFHVVWYDAHHEFAPSKLKHT